MSYVYDHQQQQQPQSVMETSSDEETDDESMMGDHSLTDEHMHPGQDVDHVEDGLHDEEMYSDDGSESSIPDEFIDFTLNYALHTFLATVEGQASVVKGDSLVLLDDANSYWWLVRVLKTEDVGYIPAENIETPYERLARLNKHRNVELAAATLVEQQEGDVKGRMVLKDVIRDKGRGLRANGSGQTREEASPEGRRVVFAPPTYVDHPGITWDEDEEEDEDYEGMEGDEEDEQDDEDEMDAEPEAVEHQVSHQHNRQESDDGMAWAEDSQRHQHLEQQQRPVDVTETRPAPQRVIPASNNPFAPSSASTGIFATAHNGGSTSSILDPAEAAGETRRITATPAVAATLLPSAVMQQQQARNFSASSVVSTVSTSASTRSGTPTSPDREDRDGRKMRKSKKSSASGDESGGEEKKKKKGVLGGLFSRNKKDKEKKAAKGAGIEGGRVQRSFDSEGAQGRSSEESSVAGVNNSPMNSIRTGTPQNQHGQQPPPSASTSSTGPSLVSLQAASVSPHGLRLQQLDKEIQQSYHHKYLSKPPSTDLSGLTGDPAGNVAQSIAAQRLAKATGNGNSSPARPGSIILSPNPNGGPVLSVLRIFAGEHIQSEASFKTVLLNEATLSTDLIRQAVQRFHLHGHGEDNVEYFLTVKDLEGDELVLSDEDKPLAAFEDAVRHWREDGGTDDTMTARTVKRSSVGSISSISSNLSMHPAIAKLGMNDFSDDSAVKIYLNRRVDGPAQSGSYQSDLTAEQVLDDEHRRKGNPALTVLTNGVASPERSSPSARFTIQIVIHPDDLPEGKLLSERTRYFSLPRNATVVEAIEGGLERFGITEGVVDGGDEIEDKIAKRRSVTRVRYGLSVTYGNEERALNPSSKLLEAYTRGPPSMKTMDRMSMEQRRRSRDSSQNAGQALDILPSDPIFVLRRAAVKGIGEVMTSRTTGQLEKQQKLPAIAADSPEASEAYRSGAMSPQQIIAAQRAASRANQKALISAQVNASQGVDVVLPNQGTLRSARLGVPGQEQVRYSFISGDGETYDISDLIEQEWGKESAKVLQPPNLLRTTTGNSSYHTAPSTPDSGMVASPLEEANSDPNDILQGVLQRSRGEPEAHLQEKIHRVLDKVRAGASGRPITRDEVGKRSVSPAVGQPPLSPLPEGGVYERSERSSSRQGQDAPRSNSRQALVNSARIASRHRQQPSIASILSDFSAETDAGTSTPLTAATSTNPTPPVGNYHHAVRLNSTSPTPLPPTPVAYQDDFGIKQMLAVIEARARDITPKETERPALDEVEKMFYGEKPDMASAHPSVRQSFQPLQARLDALEKELDELLGSLVVAQ